jgi:tetratricopeptide (TPR) repeat protein
MKIRLAYSIGVLTTALTLLSTVSWHSCGVAAAEENSQTGRAGNWRKGAQGAPDLEKSKARAKAEPDNAEAQNDYGWALRQNGDTEKAEVYLEKAKKLNPALAYVHSNLSVVLLDKGKASDSLNEAKEAVKDDGNQPIYRVVYGNALLASNKTKEAIEQYQEATKLKPDYENAFYNLGRAFNQDGERMKALAALSTALQLDKDDDRVVKLMDDLMQR